MSQLPGDASGLWLRNNFEKGKTHEKIKQNKTKVEAVLGCLLCDDSN